MMCIHFRDVPIHFYPSRYLGVYFLYYKFFGVELPLCYQFSILVCHLFIVIFYFNSCHLFEDVMIPWYLWCCWISHHNKAFIWCLEMLSLLHFRQHGNEFFLVCAFKDKGRNIVSLKAAVPLVMFLIHYHDLWLF